MEKNRKENVLKCICGAPWSGHMVLDEKESIGLNPYCRECDIFIWPSNGEFKVHVSTGWNGKIINFYKNGKAKEVKDSVSVHDLPRDHLYWTILKDRAQNQIDLQRKSDDLE
jgi:hypothetical protein